MLKGNLKELHSAFRSQRAPVAFIGSGLSTNFMPWNEFILKLADRAENENASNWLSGLIKGPHKSCISIEDLLCIARESIEKINSSVELSEFMRECFQPSEKVPTVYEAIVRAPFAFYITTNYDTNIEDAYQKCHGKPLETLTFEDSEKVLRRVATGEKFLLKLHGCAQKSDNFVISDRDYNEIIHGSHSVRLMISTIFCSHSVVFMGFGHRDPNVTSLMVQHRATLRAGGQRHFTFLKDQQNQPYDVSSLFNSQYGVSSVRIDDWFKIESILYQVTFLRLSDRYAFTRIENYGSYKKFTDQLDLKYIWGAFLYAAASSEVGRPESAIELWDIVESNKKIKEKVTETPELNAIFLLVVGQYFKRTKERHKATIVFDNLAKVLINNESLISTLRSKGLRYSALFFHKIDKEKALKLLSLAEELVGASDGEEMFNVMKWKLVLSGQASAVLELTKLANDVFDKKFVKAAGWCRFGAVKLAYELDMPISEELKEELNRALHEFESIDHLQGIAESTLLMCKLDDVFCLSKKSKKEMLEKVTGISKLCGLVSAQASAEQILHSIQ